MHVIRQLGASVESSSGAILAGADWNVEPATIEESGFTRKAGLISVAPVHRPCVMSSSTSTVDFFLCSHDVVRLVEKVGVAAEWHGG
eukprot:1895048-Pyramimonas_sp.AAC.1